MPEAIKLPMWFILSPIRPYFINDGFTILWLLPEATVMASQCDYSRLAVCLQISQMIARRKDTISRVWVNILLEHNSYPSTVENLRLLTTLFIQKQFELGKFGNPQTRSLDWTISELNHVIAKTSKPSSSGGWGASTPKEWLPAMWFKRPHLPCRLYTPYFTTR